MPFVIYKPAKTGFPKAHIYQWINLGKYRRFNNIHIADLIPTLREMSRNGSVTMSIAMWLIILDCIIFGKNAFN